MTGSRDLAAQSISAREQPGANPELDCIPFDDLCRKRKGASLSMARVSFQEMSDEQSTNGCGLHHSTACA